MEPRAKILIIDDDFDFVHATRKVLESVPYEVIVAFDGEEGLRKAREEKPDLILLDIIMPLRDGFTVCDELKSSPEFAQVPVLMLTSFSQKVAETSLSLSQGLSLEAEDYIDKPIAPADLLNRVEKHLEKRTYRIRALRATEPFEELSDNQVGRIVNLCREEIHEAGTTLFNERDEANTLYLVREGKVALLTRTGPSPTAEMMTVDVITRGRCFGWSALVAPHVFTLSAKCLEKSRLLALSRTDMQRLFEEDPDMGYKVMKRLTTIISSRTRVIREKLMRAR